MSRRVRRSIADSLHLVLFEDILQWQGSSLWDRKSFACKSFNSIECLESVADHIEQILTLPDVASEAGARKTIVFCDDGLTGGEISRVVAALTTPVIGAGLQPLYTSNASMIMTCAGLHSSVDQSVSAQSYSGRVLLRYDIRTLTYSLLSAVYF